MGSTPVTPTIHIIIYYNRRNTKCFVISRDSVIALKATNLLSYFGTRILDPDKTEECFPFIYTRSFVGIHRAVARRSRTIKDYFYLLWKRGRVV